MANQLLGLNAGVQVGPPNGPNEPLPPDPPLNLGFLGAILANTPEFMKKWYLSLGDTYDVFHYMRSLRSTDSVGNVQQPGPPNWREAHLQPVQKNFYREHFRTAWRSLEQAEKYREENRITIVKGGGAEKPLLQLYEANFPACLVEALEANNCTSDLSPIQAQCWPIALKGKDLLAVLRTAAEGKVLAYILPASVHVLHQPPLKPHQSFLALVLVPTPEDARKIQRMVGELETHTGVRATCVCSGDPKEQQLRALSHGFEICVATPGRLHAFLKEGKLNISRCTYLVLDEADRMVDMGFEQQLIAIAKYVRPDRQTLMCMSRKPRELYRLVDSLLKDYVEVHFGERQPLPNRSVEHVVYISAVSEKEARLVGLLEDILDGQEEVAARKVIVFAETKKRVDDLVTNLRRRDWPVVGLHGGTTELARDWALAAFRRDKTSILVATDVATRQLPSDGVRYVVNYDYPSSAEAYSQRISHVSLSTSEPGVAYTFLEPDNSRCAREMIGILREAKRKVHPRLYAIAKKSKRRKREGVTDV
ncbi:probable ATP-dependent RNA helicase DDX5 [Rhipicephalus sanguineus]|uniref:RNA helicase n=1 Tax=Rhipicephalus sanguineus TaxID=34632 RepID=A0A9D4PS82_RHISA|nr:probable ATP-dependent RNA helicase DDX5 [Rhipicephalus sanguineus]KAH7951394.1 hypothetical protein HPB52_008470 [Rhipicephalus sanguineus]